ncbi:MAG: shikimate dehydrogenase [Propylenella sp.]
MAQTDRFLLAGVIGWPVMHSRSPAIHNYLFKQHGLKGAYVPLAIRPEGLCTALKALPVLLFSGCNLTIPHKEEAMAIVDRVDAAAEAIGAISCVIVEPDGSLTGHNNDHFGYTAGLLEAEPAWRADAGPIVVIGAGGGGRAVVYSLVRRGAREIRLVNRTRSRAEALKRSIGGPIEVLAWEERNRSLAGASMLVNVTSQGMSGNPPLDIDLAELPKSALVSDIIYIPRETPLLAAARERGNRTVNGLAMLLHQVRPAWKAWFGIEPKITPELRAAIEATI